MKHTAILGMAVLALAATAVAEEPARINVAVLDFQATNSPATDAVAITGFIRSAVIRTNKYVVVEKNNMDRILAEQAFQQTGCTSSDCAVKLGKLLNVRKMIVGEYSVMEGTRYLVASLVDVETGAIERTAKTRGFSTADLDDTADRLVAQLARADVASAEGPKEPRWNQEFGLFIGGEFGPAGFVNQTPASRGALSINTSDPNSNWGPMALGLRVMVLSWLAVDGWFSPTGPGSGAKFDLTAGGTQFNDKYKVQYGGGGGGTISWVCPLSDSFRAFVGGGAGYYGFTVESNGFSGEGPGSPGRFVGETAGDTDAAVVRPYARAMVEWVPRRRFAVDVFAHVYLRRDPIKVRFEGEGSFVGTTLEVAEFVLPRVAGGFLLVFYF